MVLPSATPPQKKKTSLPGPVRSSKRIARVQKPDEQNYVSSLLAGVQTIVKKEKHSKPWLSCC